VYDAMSNIIKRTPDLQFALDVEAAGRHSGQALSVGLPRQKATVNPAHAKNVARQQQLFRLMRFNMAQGG